MIIVPPQDSTALRCFFARRAHTFFLGGQNPASGKRHAGAPGHRQRAPAAAGRCAGKGLPPQFRAFARELRLFSVSLLLFAADCGNIIRQYCFAAEYALVAQPVEHLTFNQRARDSSSLERTKIPRRIVRFLVGFSFFWGSAHFCTLFAHRRESRVFPCIVCILCIVAELVGPRPDKLSGICDRECQGLQGTSRWFCKFYCRNAVIVGLIAWRSSAFPFNQCISAF